MRSILSLQTFLALTTAFVLPATLPATTTEQPLLDLTPPAADVAPSSSWPSSTPLPLIIWHGLGDNFQASGLKETAKLAIATNPGTSVYIIRLANDSSADRKATFFGNVTEQLSTVCSAIAGHPVLSRAPAVNALGFSQGGQFLRGYVERCNQPPVRSLVTFGSQHNGIARFQKCEKFDFLCKSVQALLAANTWSELAQGTLVPAQYYRDPADLETYLEKSNFLADINNERNKTRNATYAENIARLEKFVMYLFDEDVTVVPRESGWFAEVNATSGEVVPLRNRTLYREDWVGLRRLDEKGGLELRSVPGKHMELSDGVLKEAFKRYFGVSINGTMGAEVVQQSGDWIFNNEREFKEEKGKMVQRVDPSWLDL